MKVLTTQKAFTEREWLPVVREVPEFIESILKSDQWTFETTTDSYVQFRRKSDDYQLRLWGTVV